MKKINSLFIIGFSLIIIFQACKEPIEPLPELTVTATQLTIEYGATANILWTAVNATTCFSDIGNITGVSGSVTTPPLIKTTTYTFTATGPGGTVTATITIQVNVAPKPVLKVTVDNDTIRKGQTVNLLIESTNAVNITVKGVTAGNVMDVGHTVPVTTEKTFPALNGTFTSWPLLETTQFTVTATGIDGSIAVAAPIVVIPTRRDTIIGRYWMFSQESKTFFRGIWSPRNWTEDDLSERLIFHENGLYEYVKKNGSATGNGNPWNLVGQDSINMAGNVLRIEKLSDTTLILSIDYLNFGEPMLAITVFKGYKKN